MKALVLDAKENQALATVRSLSEHGFWVTSADDTYLSKSFYCTDCTRWFVYPSPRLNVDSFLNSLLSELHRTHYDIIFPMTEKTIWPISLARELFPKETLLPIPPHNVLVRAFNKRESINAAIKIGVPVPNTYFPEDIEEVKRLAKEIRYPVVIKSSQSENLIANKIISGGSPRYANDLHTLLKVCESYDWRLPPPLLQEFIPGTGHGIFTLFHESEPMVWFAHRRLRDVRPTGSGSSLRESVDPDEDIRGLSEKLLRSIGWEGVAMVEFRRDSRDGTAKLMEINGRFWNSLPLSIASGVDFPYLLYRAFAGLEMPEPITYRRNIQCRWFLGDIRHFIAVMRGKPKNFQGDFPKRFPTLQNIVRDTFNKEIYSDTWSVKDPLPSFIEIAELAWRALKTKWKSHF